MQRAQLRPASVCGAPSRMQPLATSRRRSSCIKCQQQHHNFPEHDESQQALLSIGRKVAAMTAAAMLMVEPAGARPGQRLIDSARKTQQEFEEIFKSRGGFPEVHQSKKEQESSATRPQEQKPLEFKLEGPIEKSSRIQGDFLGDRAEPDAVKSSGPATAPPQQAEAKKGQVNIFSGESSAGGIGAANTLKSGDDEKAAQQEAKDKKFAAESAETQDQMKGPTPPQFAPKQSDSTESTFNPIKSAFPLDPAAPVGKGAQSTQEVDKTPTPPPQDSNSTLEPAPTASETASGGASESTPSQTPAGGFAGFFESLKSKIGQSSQSTSTGEDKVSAADSGSTALEGNPSPSPSLTAAIEAETDKNSEKPAVQALIEGNQGANNDVKPEQIAQQVEQAGKASEDSGDLGGAAASDSTPSQTPAGGFAGFFEGLKSKIGQPSQSTSTSEDKVSAAESGSTALEGNPSPSPSLTAAIEAETDKNSEKPAVQALIEGNQGANNDVKPEQIAQQVEQAGKASADSADVGGASASDSTTSQTPTGGFSSFIEGLKSNFGQSSQSTSDQGGDQASVPGPQGGDGAPEPVSTALEGNPSPSPSLTAAIEAETDKNSETPAVQALIEGNQGANNDVKPEQIAQQVEQAGQASDEGSRAPGGASETALSQTPAGGFANFFEGLKSTFGQSSQNPEATTSDEALVAAASKAADEAADKALQGVGSQAADTSATPGIGANQGAANDAKPEQIAQQVEQAGRAFEGSGIAGSTTEVAFSPAEGFASFVEALKSNFGQPREQNTSTAVPDTSVVDRRPSDSIKSVAEPEVAQPGNPFTQFLDSMNSTFPPEKKKPHSAQEATAPSANDSAPNSGSIGGKAEEAVQAVKDAAPEENKAESSDNIVTQFVDSMTSTFPPEKSSEEEPAAQPKTDSGPDSSGLGRKAEEAVQSVKDATPDADKAESGNPVSQFVDSMNSTFPPEKNEGSAQKAADQSETDSAPNSSSLGGKADSAVQSVTDAASEGDESEDKASGNPISQFLNSTFPPEKPSGDGAQDSAAQPASDSADGGSSLGGKAEQAAQSVSSAASDSGSLGDKVESTAQAVTDAVQEGDKPPGNPVTQFLDNMKSTFPPEKSSGDTPEEASSQPVSDSVSDDSSLGGKAESTVQPVTATAVEAKPAWNLITQLADSMKSTSSPEQSVQSAGDSAQQAASSGQAAASKVSDSVSGGLEAVKKSPNSNKAINDEPAGAQQSDSPAVSSITSFVDSAKEKLQPDQNPAEAASAAAQSVSESVPDSSSLGGKAKDAVQSVSDAAPDGAKDGGKTADVAQSVTDAAPDSSSLGGKAKEAVQSVSDAASDTADTAKDTAAAVQSAAAPSEKDVLDSSPKAGLVNAADNLNKEAQSAQPEQSMQSMAGSEAPQSVSKGFSTDKASSALQSVGDKVQESASSAQQSVSESVSDSAEASGSADSGSSSQGSLQTVSDKAPDAEGAEAGKLASKAANAVTEKLPNSMGGKDKLENVAPDSVPGKFEGIVDNLASKLPGQPEQSTQSTQSAPAAEVSGSNSNSAADTIVREVSDNISESVGPITPSKGQEPAQGDSDGKHSAGNVLTAVSDKVAGVTNDALDQAESSFGSNPVEQVSAGAEAASRDAGKDASNPANTGAAPKQAAPTASDTSKQGHGVQSVADPANVEQALDSVGDAVENAVPDPKGAESGLAPTAEKQVATTHSEDSLKSELAPGLQEIAGTAQRKVQRATPQLTDPSKGIVAFKEAAVTLFAYVMPVPPADAAMIEFNSCACQTAPAREDAPSGGSAVTKKGDSPASQQTPDGEVVKAASKKIAIPVPEAGSAFASQTAGAGDSAAAQKTPEAIKEAGSKIASAVVEAGDSVAKSQQAPTGEATKAAAPEAASKPGASADSQKAPAKEPAAQVASSSGDSGASQKASGSETVKDAGSKVASAVTDAGDSIAKSDNTPGKGAAKNGGTEGAQAAGKPGDSNASQKAASPKGSNTEAVKEAGSKVASAVTEAGDSISKSQKAPAGETAKDTGSEGAAAAKDAASKTADAAKGADSDGAKPASKAGDSIAKSQDAPAGDSAKDAAPKETASEGAAAAKEAASKTATAAKGAASDGAKLASKAGESISKSQEAPAGDSAKNTASKDTASEGAAAAKDAASKAATAAKGAASDGAKLGSKAGDSIAKSQDAPGNEGAEKQLDWSYGPPEGASKPGDSVAKSQKAPAGDSAKDTVAEGAAPAKNAASTGAAAAKDVASEGVKAASKAGDSNASQKAPNGNVVTEAASKVSTAVSGAGDSIASQKAPDGSLSASQNAPSEEAVTSAASQIAAAVSKAGDSITSQKMPNGDTITEAASRVAVAVRDAGESITSQNTPEAVSEAASNAAAAVRQAGDSLKSQKVPEEASEAAAKFASVVREAGDSIKVPEAATEAASNVTAAVRKAGDSLSNLEVPTRADVKAGASKAGAAVARQASSDTGKQVLLSVQGIAVLAIIVYSLVSKPPAVAQVKDAATKVKDLNDY